MKGEGSLGSTSSSSGSGGSSSRSGGPTSSAPVNSKKSANSAPAADDQRRAELLTTAAAVSMDGAAGHSELEQSGAGTMGGDGSGGGGGGRVTPYGRFSTYLVAMRPWSFSASLTPVVLGSVLAYHAVGSFSTGIFLATCLTALSVHAAGNLVNTYGDFVRGVDSKKSDDRTLVDEILRPSDVATLGAVFYLCGCCGFLVLVLLSPARMEHLALVYFGGLSGSFLYTGGLGLKYLALGDLVIFLTFGPVTVLFAYLTQGGPLSWTPLLYAVPIALNTEAILHCNNSRDRRTDAEAGIVTLAILIGEKGSYALFALLLFTPYVIFAVQALHVSAYFVLPLATVILAFPLERSFRDGQLGRLPQRLAALNLQLGLLYGLACALAKTLPQITRS